jgi:hypothetical protein
LHTYAIPAAQKGWPAFAMGADAAADSENRAALAAKAPEVKILSSRTPPVNRSGPGAVVASDAMG